MIRKTLIIIKNNKPNLQQRDQRDEFSKVYNYLL